jgi:hypothetical protein
MRLGEAQFPWDARVLDARLRRRASATIVTTDEDNIGMRFGDSRGDCAYPNFGNELDADARMMVSVLQIVD